MERDIYDRSTYDAAQHLAAGSEYFQADCKHHEAAKILCKIHHGDDTVARRRCNEAWSRRFKAWDIMRGWEITLQCVNMSEDEYRDLRYQVAAERNDDAELDRIDEYEAQQNA